MPATSRVALMTLPFLVAAFLAHARTNSTVISNFGPTPSPHSPYGPLLRDTRGNLFGTTTRGGNPLRPNTTIGTIFELSPPHAGQPQWVQTVLYEFGANDPDGARPMAGLTFDQSGNLFTTTVDGAFMHGAGERTGAVVELSPPASGQTAWTERVVHVFGKTAGDGVNPGAGVLIDPSGDLYTTTYYGGTQYLGTVVRLTPAASGGYLEKVIYSFAGADALDGAFPSASLTPGPNGGLFTTTRFGGRFNDGALIFLRPTGGGGWRERVLHSFQAGIDGAEPVTAPVFDSAGALYVTCSSGGPTATSAGTVVQFHPPTTDGQAWNETIIHVFDPSVAGELAEPNQVLPDRTGAIFLTAAGDGAGGYGGVAKLTPPIGPSGAWTETILHTFKSGAAGGGTEPTAALIADPNGNLFTTTFYGGGVGGRGGHGTAIELTGTGFVPE